MSDRGREDTQTLSSDLFCMRAIGILLVVVVHVLGVDAVHGVRKLFPPERTDLRVVVELLHSFNMAVMLMGSGVAVAAFGRADLSLSDFLRKKVNKLLIPMVVWAPVLFLMQELSRGGPQGLEGWLGLLRRVPFTWFPPYSIFWFVHALVGCTLLAWLFRKLAAPALGRWSGLVYFGLALLLHLAVNAWGVGALGGPGEYIELILSWNRFFGLGLLIYPWLAPVSQALARPPVALQALLPVGLFALIALVYGVLPSEQYAVVCAINGPLGFCMLFSLAVFLRSRVSVWGAAWRSAWSRLVFVGSISMAIYLFHLYFVSGTRIALERWNPGTPLAVHLVLGLLAGCVGPWLLFQTFKGYPPFQWSVGLTLRVPRRDTQEGPLRQELAPLPWAPERSSPHRG
jgi:fucose 4-O-acetylase-like acetyltransferase